MPPGTWAADGNTTTEHIRRVLAMLEDGDPQAYDYLPNEPNLSGEWGDDPTPLSLARDITGLEDPADELTSELSDAFEEGVRETFHESCERELRAFLPAED
jgi:hypothetical protein